MFCIPPGCSRSPRKNTGKKNHNTELSVQKHEHECSMFLNIYKNECVCVYMCVYFRCSNKVIKIKHCKCMNKVSYGYFLHPQIVRPSSVP